MAPGEDAVQLHDMNVHLLELDMVDGEEEYMKKAVLSEPVEDADQLFEMKAKMLPLTTVKGPVMYVGNPPFSDAVALKVDRCITKDALFTSETFSSITIFA